MEEVRSGHTAARVMGAEGPERRQEDRQEPVLGHLAKVPPQAETATQGVRERAVGHRVRNEGRVPGPGRTKATAQEAIGRGRERDQHPEAGGRRPEAGVQDDKQKSKRDKSGGKAWETTNTDNIFALM